MNIEATFDEKGEEAADFYSFQGELVACLSVLSVIISAFWDIILIVNCQCFGEKKITFGGRFGFTSPPGRKGKVLYSLARSASCSNHCHDWEKSSSTSLRA